MTNEVCSHVRVVVRVRPTNDNERCENLRNVVQVVDNHMLIFDPREQGIQSFGAQHVQRRDVNKRSVKDLKFVFDAVFGEHSTQVDIFENTTKLVLDGVLNGFNCTVFAYGATGAGKTHTMLGSQNDPGVMYRTMKELFARMEEVKEDKVFEVAFSYLEVYNEQIRDLLANVGPLAVREDSSKGVVVQGLTLHQPKSAEHILEALDFGNKNRTQHPTDMNATSSRSHAVFQIYLRQQDKTASLNPNVRVAKLSLIDLAGSERASATNTKGARFREGANINRSLLALGNVINALANPRSKKAHIPYRDSKLTRLLKDSLGGNCRTVMIANISPSSKSYDDTHNTLKYANRAKEIKSSLKSNVVSLDSHISQYAVICEKQRQEILQLKKKLQEYEEIKMETQMPQATNDKSSHKQVEIEKVSKSLQSVFFSRTQIRREQLMLQRQLKENELRQQHSEESNQQAQLFCARDKTEKATCKHERKLASLFTQQKHICQRLGESGRRFQENESWLHRVENEIKMQGQEAQVPQVLQTELQCHRLQLQVEDLKQHIEQMTYLINLLDNEHQHTKKMVTILLPAYSRHYSTLRAAGQVTPADEAQNQELEHLVLRERAVVWADQEQAGQHLRQEGAEHKSASHTAGSSRLRPELAPTLSFSHLLYHQDSPCSAEKQTRRVSLRLQATLSSKVEPGGVMQEPFFKKPTRRKLSVSSPQSQESSSSCAQPQGHVVFREVLRQEGMFPLMYTPESVQRSVSVLPQLTSVSAKDSNTTFEVLDCDSETQANSTIIIHNGSPNQTANSSSSPPLQNLPLFQPPKVNCGSQQPTKRLKIPTLLDVTRAKTATYMAMTSAAQGKRRFNCIGEDHIVGFSAPKRIKQDLSMVSKPLRVRRPAGSGENESRRVMRSVSEGNLNLMEAQKSKSKSIFYKTSQQIKRVAKRM